MPLRPVKYAPRVGSLVEANVRPAAPAGAVLAAGVATAAEHALATKTAPTTNPAIDVHLELGRMLASPGSVSVDPTSKAPVVSKGCIAGTGRGWPPVHLHHQRFRPASLRPWSGRNGEHSPLDSLKIRGPRGPVPPCARTWCLQNRPAVSPSELPSCGSPLGFRGAI